MEEFSPVDETRVVVEAGPLWAFLAMLVVGLGLLLVRRPGGGVRRVAAVLLIVVGAVGALVALVGPLTL